MHIISTYIIEFNNRRDLIQCIKGAFGSTFLDIKVTLNLKLKI